MSNIKTVIAAGGLGTRLQGFRGNDSTKILLEVDGSPMIIRQIEQLTNWGLDEFIIITNPSFDELIKDVVNSYFPDKKISFTIQHEQKGISHALLCAKEYIHHGDTVFFILGDNFFEYSPTKNLNLDEIGVNKGAHIFSHKVDNPKNLVLLNSILIIMLFQLKKSQIHQSLIKQLLAFISMTILLSTKL